MAVYSISLSGLPPSLEQAVAWCAQLEEGDVLYFPESPVRVSGEDLEFLLGHQQIDSKVHKI